MKRSPVATYLPEQADGIPGMVSGAFIVKFTNFGTFRLPEGWPGLLVGFLLTRLDLLFRGLSGMVSANK